MATYGWSGDIINAEGDHEGISGYFESDYSHRRRPMYLFRQAKDLARLKHQLKSYDLESIEIDDVWLDSSEPWEREGEDENLCELAVTAFSL